MSFKNFFISITELARRWPNRLTELHILLPAIAVITLILLWGATLNTIRIERVAAEHAAAMSSRELRETYEAQVIRALREIDLTMKFVKYVHDLKGKYTVLQELKDQTLLPPDLLFVVSIADSSGNIVASTRPLEAANVADQDYFQHQLHADTLFIGRPHKSVASGQWELQFSRRLNAADGTFSGIEIVSVDAAYFVSSYESSTFGENGMLGILGTDGVFRIRRSGEKVFAGDVVNYASVVPATDEMEGDTALSINAWDGVLRYTSTRQLHNFPLAVIVGLSADEQLALAQQDKQSYLKRAGIASILLILIVWTLARLSKQLALSRKRAFDEQVAHAAQVEYLAYHDGLTSLANRSLFSKQLSHSIKQAHRNKRELAVVFLDLDHFKHINDTLGHDAGDQLLQEVAARLKSCLRDSDTVARLGGDEFVVLLPELDEYGDVTAVAQKILSAIARPFALKGQEFHVTASIGISKYPQDGLDEQTLTKAADIAMYEAKSGGKNNFRYFSEEMNAATLERLNLESGLRRALERCEFQLHYQLKRDIRSGRINGMEALLRWQHPDLGTVAPMQFLSVAEEAGLIVPIGKWVFKTACLQNIAWQSQGLPHFSIAVNLTARQFYDESLSADLTTILADTGMDPHLLELEITEGVLMRDVTKTLQILTRLKEIGVKIAIDDFGVGYSSLSTLKKFPLDTIKIDRSFIRDASSVAEDKALTEAIIAMGKTLSLTVVAQGVETKEQADFLRQNACNELQGFYLNKPLPAHQLTALLAA